MGDKNVTREPYFKYGKLPAGDPLGPGEKHECTRCNECEQVFVEDAVTVLYDSETDTAQTFNLFKATLLPQALALLWRKAWNAFDCKNDACKSRKACGDKPTWFEFGAETAKGLAGRWKWRFYGRLAREIQCVDEKPAPKDVDPKVETIVIPPKDEKTEKPDKDDGPGKGDKGKSDKSDKPKSDDPKGDPAPGWGGSGWKSQKPGKPKKPPRPGRRAGHD